MWPETRGYGMMSSQLRESESMSDSVSPDVVVRECERQFHMLMVDWEWGRESRGGVWQLSTFGHVGL